MSVKRSSLPLAVAAGAIGVAAPWIALSRAAIPAPSVEKNYRVEMAHAFSHNFHALEDEGEESVRVEEVLLRTSRHPKVVRWRESVGKLRGLDAVAQVEGVNRLVNDLIHYRDDYEHWNREDKWGFPFATLDEGGDCEDFATLKRVSLHLLGWPQDGLFLLLGFSTMGETPESHAVLLVTLPDGSQVILDSLEKHVLPPADDHHFKPMMAIDRDSLYIVGLSRGADSRSAGLRMERIAGGATGDERRSGSGSRRSRPVPPA